MSKADEKLAAAAEKLGVGRIARHVFLCVGGSCCDPKVGDKAWDALKEAI